MSDEAPCPGCGLVLPEYVGPTHPYVGSSAACWALYGALLAREYGELGYPECHRLTVDAYAVQHPGRRERRSIQSVDTHLCGLYLMLERGIDGPGATALKNRILATGPRFRWLNPPATSEALTVLDVLHRDDNEQHCDVVERWAGSVWDAWELHHETVRDWVETALQKVK
ncbi:MAG: DUF5946 family protein [Actinomycetota bacterium]